MEPKTYAKRKSRVAFQKADGSVSEWLSFGEAKVFGPGHKDPIRLGPGHLFIVSNENEDLREAVFVLQNEVGRWTQRVLWYILTLSLSACLLRLYVSLL